MKLRHLSIFIPVICMAVLEIHATGEVKSTLSIIRCDTPRTEIDARGKKKAMVTKDFNYCTPVNQEVWTALDSALAHSRYYSDPDKYQVLEASFYDAATNARLSLKECNCLITDSIDLTSDFYVALFADPALNSDINEVLALYDSETGKKEIYLNERDLTYFNKRYYLIPQRLRGQLTEFVKRLEIPVDNKKDKEYHSRYFSDYFSAYYINAVLRWDAKNRTFREVTLDGDSGCVFFQIFE